MTIVVCVLAGLLITISALAARGTDLRSDRNLSLRELIVQQGQRNTELQGEIDALRGEVDELSGKDLDLGDLRRRVAQAEQQASAAPVEGPGMRVMLTDAPADVKPAGVDDDALVVHQQDIQAVMNALWDGGAEAMTLQGERVISTTGVKCVGNTVVLHGVAYAPPYVVEAIGDTDRLTEALDSARAVQIYRQYVDAYGLGFQTETVPTIEMPGYTGVLGVTHARVP